MAQACGARALAARWRTPTAQSKKRYIINSYPCLFHLGYRPIYACVDQNQTGLWPCHAHGYHPHMPIKTLDNTHNISRQGLVV
jgi:hypothetical protein